MRLEQLVPQARVSGVVHGEPVTVVGLDWHGADAVAVTYRRQAGSLHDQVLYRADEPKLTIAVEPSRRRIRRTEVAETRTPSARHSPTIRTYPQRGFSRASRTTTATISSSRPR